MIAGSLVVVVVAGLVTWAVWPDSAVARNRVPFEQAVTGLAQAQGMHYTDTSIVGEQRDITTTRLGEQFGVTRDSDNDPNAQGVLRAGGKLYTKFQNNTDELGKWTVGSGLEKNYDDLENDFPAPQKLAANLSTALAGTPNLPAPGDANLPDLKIGGVPALRAETPAGSLYVSRDAPYRVLRLEPLGALTPSRLKSEPGLPTSLPDVPASAPEQDSQGMDMTPIDAADAGPMYDTLEDDTDQLSDAVDAGIDFSLDSEGTFNCSGAGCNVLESFTGTLTTDTKTRLTGGKVTAKLTVTNVAIDGRPAGGCVSAPITLPIEGNTVSGQLSCDDPAAGPIFTAVDQQYQELAQQEANAAGGQVTTSYSTTADAKVDAEAVGEADVDQLLGDEEQERDAASCPAPNSFLPGTPVVLADGSTRPIGQVTPGTLVLATDPATGSTMAEPVLAQIVGTGPKNLDQVGIADGLRTTTVTATTNHPFWDPGKRAWVDAEDLRAGELLSTLPGYAPVHVVGTQPYSANLSVDNLTVADVHSYYVEPDGVPVLVHNADPTCFPEKSGTQSGNDPNLGRLRPAERQTLARAQKEYPQLGLKASAEERDGEYLDSQGRTYDQMGNPYASRFWDRPGAPQKFYQAIQDHMNKSMDFTLIDLTGFSEQSIGDIQQYVDSLPRAQQAKIVRIGF